MNQRVAEAVIGLVATGSVSLLAWIALTMYDLNAQVQVMATKVEESHQMIKPLWEDYIRRTAALDSLKHERVAAGK